MRSWDDSFHCNNEVITSQNTLVTLCTPSLNVSSPQSFCHTTSNAPLVVSTTESDNFMKMDSNSSKKRKRKGSMDATNIEDDNMMCSFLENLLQTNSNTAQSTKSKRTKRYSSSEVQSTVIPRTTTCYSSTTSPLYCNNNHYQAKYQMSVSYSTSFLK